MREENSIKSQNQGIQFNELFKNEEPKNKNLFYVYRVLLL